MPRPLGGTITRSANYLIAQIAGMRWRMKKFRPEKMVSATLTATIKSNMAPLPSFLLPFLVRKISSTRVQDSRIGNVHRRCNNWNLKRCVFTSFKREDGWLAIRSFQQLKDEVFDGSKFPWISHELD